MNIGDRVNIKVGDYKNKKVKITEIDSVLYNGEDKTRYLVTGKGVGGAIKKIDGKKVIQEDSRFYFEEMLEEI